MKIQSSELKSLLKKVNSVKGDSLVLSPGGLVAQDSDITVCVASDKFAEFSNQCVDARKFSSVVNRMSGEISVGVVAEKHIFISSGKAYVTMEFKAPKPYVFKRPESLVELDLAVVKNLLKYTSSAASTNKADSMFGGFVILESTIKGIDPEECVGLESMGTDGHKCAFISVPAKHSAKLHYLIPLPAVAAIQAMDGDKLQIGETPFSYFISCGGVTVYANKLSRQYPNYKSFLPTKFAFSVALSAIELKRVLHSVEPMIQDAEQNGVYFHFLDGVLKVSTAGKSNCAEDQMKYEADPLAEEFKIKLSMKAVYDYLNYAVESIIFNGNSDKEPVILASGPHKFMVSAIKGGS